MRGGRDCTAFGPQLCCLLLHVYAGLAATRGGGTYVWMEPHAQPMQACLTQDGRGQQDLSPSARSEHLLKHTLNYILTPQSNPMLTYNITYNVKSHIQFKLGIKIEPHIESICDSNVATHKYSDMFSNRLPYSMMQTLT